MYTPQHPHNCNREIKLLKLKANYNGLASLESSHPIVIAR